MRDGGETRERILSVAVELFAEVGYDKASIRELASRLGFTTTALYYHFRNKQEILTTLAGGVYSALGELVDEAEKEPPSVQRSRSLLGRYLDLVIELGGVMTVLESSIATLRALPEAKESAETMDRLAGLVALGPGEAPRLRATAALGILTTLPSRIPEHARGELRPHLLAAAYGALEHPVGRQHN